MKFPTISVCVATYNSGKTLDKCLRLVRTQNYPKNNIEIVLGDGGSTDDTLKIAKKYSAKIIKIPKEKQHAEYNRGIAFNEAKNEFVLILDHDNFLPYKNWLIDMVEPLQKHPEAVASTTCYYHYDKSYDLMDRYFALFGTSEPLPYFLHKADRMPQYANTWVLQGKAEDMGKYYLVKLSPDAKKFISVGTNGCLMRRKLVLENAQADPDYHYPIDVLFDVTRKGFDTFIFVKNSIIHLTHSSGLLEFLKRRKRFVEQYHFQEHGRRRWSVVVGGEEWKVFLYVIYSLTVVGPLIESIRGYVKKPDAAWFMHPLMCFGTTLIYGYITFKYFLFPLKK